MFLLSFFSVTLPQGRPGARVEESPRTWNPAHVLSRGIKSVKKMCCVKQEAQQEASSIFSYKPKGNYLLTWGNNGNLWSGHRQGSGMFQT